MKNQKVVIEDLDKNNGIKKNNRFFKTKAGKVCLALGAATVLAGGVVIITHTPAYKTMKEEKAYEYEKVDAVPVLKGEGVLVYDPYFDQYGVPRTSEDEDYVRIAVDYIKLEGYELIFDSNTKLYYYCKDNVKVAEAIPIVPTGYDLVMTENGYMAQSQLASGLEKGINYIVPEGYTLMQDENGNYYGVKVKSNTKTNEETKIKVFGN